MALVTRERAARRPGTSTSALATALLVPMISALGAGCAANADEADRYREALPLEEEVALRVPEGGTGRTSQGLRIATQTGTDATARYYQLTRDLTTSVDVGTATILGSIWTLVHTTPTSVDAKKAVWGPGAASALEPAIWRFIVTEVGDSAYDYVLEGQPRAGGAWLAVLTGHGFGKAHPEHKRGSFRVDNDAFRSLDPARMQNEGGMMVTYDLRQRPATIAVELRPSAEKGWVDVKVTHAEAGAGSVEVTALADLDASKATKLEDIHVLSRWASDGSGRADVVMKNGDLPFVIDATECWSTSFARVFYEDTVNFEPSSGDPSACTLGQE